MATLVLATAGQAAGTFLGGAGSFLAVAGRAAGAIAGNVIDQRLFGSDTDSQPYEGPRIENLSVQASSEGQGIYRVYGRVRIGGQVIWAANFKETIHREVTTTTTETGGKGGGSQSTEAETVEYRYSASFAVGLCEGEISHIERIWADGHPLDTSDLTVRIYRGTEDQLPDDLISAMEGAAPAYRGLCYVVFEDLPLEDYGNRLPQMNFEVVRSREPLEQMIRAVNIIPGAAEFAYDPNTVTRTVGAGQTENVNHHLPGSGSDWKRSIGQLQALCPGLEWASLIVTWFGTDLRCGNCRIEPRVDAATKATVGDTWSVAGLTRSDAGLVSTVDGRPAFGGTPNDASVVRALKDLKARGLKTVLYPFIIMDIPDGNTLPDPYSGGAGQSIYPWRARLTCDPAPGREGSPDRSDAVEAQVASFVGTSSPAASEWSFRRQILHYASLAKSAGGVDAFIIGTEMGGLSTLRDGSDNFPFVSALRTLAADVRAILGSGTKVTYAADWSEYFGYQPDDGSGDVWFHLDPLWADPNIDMVGIDNYLPFSDWRHHDGARDHAASESPYDVGYLRAGLRSGERFDWYYASESDTRNEIRTDITDGAYGKPWVFQPKNLSYWWRNAHHNRPGGVEASQPTAWVPESKPVWFTETGVPAVDLGAVQPNVFPDEKSDEGKLPRGSTGARDDLIQRRGLEAVLTAFDRSHASGFDTENPVSGVYGGPMVDPSQIFLWAWDARPFPAFPSATDIWSDGENWRTGHWLNGRLGGISAATLMEDVFREYGIEAIDTGAADGIVDGFILAGNRSARTGLEALAGLYRIPVTDNAGRISIRPRPVKAAETLSPADLADEDGGALLKRTLADPEDLYVSVNTHFFDTFRDYLASVAKARRISVSGHRSVSFDLPVFTSLDVIEAASENWLADHWSGAEAFSFSLPPNDIRFEAGDRVTLDLPDGPFDVLIERIEDGALRRVEARRITGAKVSGSRRGIFSPPVLRRPTGAPQFAILDLPWFGSGEPGQLFCAAYASPWPGQVSVYVGNFEGGYDYAVGLNKPSVLGSLSAELPPGFTGRWDFGSSLLLHLPQADLTSQEKVEVLNGANTLGLQHDDGSWEMIQFRDAELVGDNLWTLTDLLRGQIGGEDLVENTVSAGAVCVVLDDSLKPFRPSGDAIGSTLTFRAGPSGENVLSDTYQEIEVTYRARDLLPLSPVHVSAVRQSGSSDILLTWVRRGRLQADRWSGTDIPLGEDTEFYMITIYQNGVAFRTVDVTEAFWTYTEAEQIADFGGPVPEIDIGIRQISALAGSGIEFRRVLRPDGS